MMIIRCCFCYKANTKVDDGKYEEKKIEHVSERVMCIFRLVKRELSAEEESLIFA